MVAEAATATDAVLPAREHRPDIAVRPAVLRRALLAGVRVFVPKTTPAARPAEIIRDIAAGRRYVDPDIAASALTEDDCPLTDRELEVLRVARTGASITEIAAAVHLAHARGTARPAPAGPQTNEPHNQRSAQLRQGRPVTANVVPGE